MEDESIRLFAPVIWAYVESLRKVTDKQVRTNLEGGLSTTLQKWTDQPVKMVSNKVWDECQNHNPKIDPFELLYGGRRKLNEINDKKKSILVWEHTTPLSEFSGILIECKNIEDVIEELKKYTGVCWISREEDSLLNKKGYKNLRLGGWEKCYKECGIEVRGHQ
jgi:hypothetical protein